MLLTEHMLPAITANTLSEQINEAENCGYWENFKLANGLLQSENENMSFLPMNIRITDFYRFEGFTDPQDNSILYLIETKDGRKGTLIDAYGVYADTQFGNFIRSVTTIHKKEHI